MKKKNKQSKPRGKCSKKKIKNKKSYEVVEILSLIGLTSKNLNECEKELFKEKNIKKIKKKEKNKLVINNKSLKDLKRHLYKLKLNIKEDEDTTNIPKNKRKKKCKSKI